MKIDEIKINSYGNLNNNNIQFDKLNIIYGKNESGKSTLLNFIINIFYGISKNKNGKEISDYEKYYPWNNNEFSGKIYYELNNKNKYSVYRNFDKKNPEIYDENSNDISNKFNIDKKAGNQFFYDQTNLDEETLISTVITTQTNVKLDNTTQNTLIQKVANLAESGEEEVSYKKAVAKLDKMLLNDVGTDKSQDRPINNARKNINYYQNKIEEINESKLLKNKIEENKKKINSELIEEKNKEEIYKKIKLILNENNIENEKINIKNKIINENNNKIEKNKSEKNNLKKKNNNKINLLLLSIIILINIISFVFIKNNIINISTLIFIPIYLIYIIIKNKKTDSKYIDTQIKILEKNNYELINEVEELKKELIKNNENKKNELINKYGNQISELFNSNIDLFIENNNNKINYLNLEFHKTELDYKNIEPKLEELANTEELLENEENKLNELENKSKLFQMTKDILEQAYEEMKKNVTPKFNKNLSINIEKFSNGKYKSVSLDNGISVELENGKYVSVESLSTGTIEQIYLALRLSVIDELSPETLPIMLDEAFAYYDDERLAAALKFLNEIDNQVLIFTCTEREQEILNRNSIKYNLIKIN